MIFFNPVTPFVGTCCSMGKKSAIRPFPNTSIDSTLIALHSVNCGSSSSYLSTENNVYVIFVDADDYQTTSVLQLIIFTIASTHHTSSRQAASRYLTGKRMDSTQSINAAESHKWYLKMFLQGRSYMYCFISDMPHDIFFTLEQTRYIAILFILHFPQNKMANPVGEVSEHLMYGRDTVQ